MTNGGSVACGVTIMLMLSVVGCKQEKGNTRFTKLTNSNITFKNTLTESEGFNVFKYRNFYNGGGVATGDLNNDGLPEIFFTGNAVANELYLNKGNMQFENISAKAGFEKKAQWSTGVVLVDINNDNWLDIYVCNAGNMLDKKLRANQLFINNHDLTFTERAAEYGLADSGYTTHASFFDYDKDGDLDCFVVNNSPIPVNTLNYANSRSVPEAQAPVADFLKGGGDHLYRNDNGKFTDVTYAAGLHGSIIGFGLGVSVSDVNEDGWPDVYVSNDFFERDYLYINQQNGTFKDELEERMQHISLSSMGADIQDINNDGHIDLFTTDMLPDDDYRLKTNSSFESYDVFKLKQRQGFYNQFTQNALQVNDGEGHFAETAFYSGVAASDWSWGALIFDADNDGLNDIVVCNGIYRDVTDQDFIDFFADEVMQRMVLSGKKEDVNTIIDKMPSVPIPNKIYHNKGELKFEETGTAWGLDDEGFSNGAAYADLDLDGDLDLVVNNVNQLASIYRNNSSAANGADFVQFKLQFQAPNLHAIGATVKLYSSNTTITREVYPSRGFQSSVEYTLHMGLGKIAIDSVLVTWPNGMSARLDSVKRNSVNVIRYDATPGINRDLSMHKNALTIFSRADSVFATHQEDEYVDFYQERNVPFMLSTQGPGTAVADVNADGLNDIYIGGARNQPAQLWLQKAGRFTKQSVPDFEKYRFADVTAAAFFDADGDSDQDLITGGGGNFAPAGNEAYLTLLYLNDGAGTFKLKPGSLPLNGTNCAAIVPLDYDRDGLTDLFIANRSVAHQYGAIPAAFLFRNKGAAQFEDVTKEVAPGLANAGMLTDVAVETKANNTTVIVCGEWMAPQTYSYNGKQFVRVANGLENYKGFWQRIALSDLDGDGDSDMVLANLGENFYLQASADAPAKLWVDDFDKNGLTDKFLTTSIDGRDMPVFLKREVTDQIPSLKGASLRHKEFAQKSIQQLLDKKLSPNAVPLEINTMYSAIAWNDGKGNYTISKLPLPAQLTSLHAISISDINNDGKQDLLVAGNFFDLLPQFCRLDGGYGLVLMNQGNQQFTPITAARSGIRVKQSVRSIVQPTNSTFLFITNNSAPVYYTKTK